MMDDEQPVPPQVIDGQDLTTISREMALLRLELNQAKRDIASLTSTLQRVTEEQKRLSESTNASLTSAQLLSRFAIEEAKDARYLPDCDLIIHWSDSMSFDVFAKSTSGKDINHCYFGEWPLAFYLTEHMPEQQYCCWPDPANRYHQYLTYMLDSGLNPNMKFNGKSLLRVTNDALNKKEQEIVYWKNKTDPTGWTNFTTILMKLEHVSGRYRDIRSKLMSLGAVV